MYTLPADRRPGYADGLWHPGIPGGIPNRTTVYTTLSPSGGNDYSAIQNALNSCPQGQVVKLTAGQFRTGNTDVLRIPSGVTLRGAGWNQTDIQHTPTGVSNPGSGVAAIVIGNYWTSLTGSGDVSVNLSANGIKGSYSVTVANGSGFAVGQIVLLDKTDDPAYVRRAPDDPGSWMQRSFRPTTQLLIITAVSGNTITFATPLHQNFETARTAQLTRFKPWDTPSWDAGLEDLSVRNGEGGDGGGNIRFEYAARCWALRVNSYNTHGCAVRFRHAVQCEVRDSYFHDTILPEPGGGGYSIVYDDAASDCLVENCISIRFNKVVLARACGGGNVFAYNYVDDGYGASYPSLPEVGVNGAHMTCPSHILFEGNQGWNLGSDARWGNSVYLTFLRNHSTTLRRNTVGNLTDINRWGAEAVAYHWWYSYLGNVIGRGPGTMPSADWQYQITAPGAAKWGVYVFGRPDAGGTPELNGTYDTNVEPTTIRFGNWDWLTASQIFHSPTGGGAAGSGTPDTIPNSLYLAAKPAFMGANPWPWVDPTTGATHTLPARARYDAGTYIPGAGVTLAAPANLRWRLG